MIHVQRQLGVAERRACRVLGQPRSSQRFTGCKPEKDRAVSERLVTLSRCHPRYGYRRIWALLRREGWRINRKRVQRLWRDGGLRVPPVQRKRRRLGSSEHGCQRRRAERKNHVWSYDFLMDQTADGRRLKLLPVLDEFTREAHAILVARRIRAADVVDLLASLFRVHGAPAYLRSDNGPEFIATVVKDWLAHSGVKTLYIEPGSPWENGYSESFNSRFEDELLNRETFSSVTEAQVLVEQYRLAYNHDRPHSALGYRTPVEFATEHVRPTHGPVTSLPDDTMAFDLSHWEDTLHLELEPILS